MKNFQCYYGEHESNTIEFENGINIIIGDNGGGKSKLYDAFYWVLYDQIFSSDSRNFTRTAQYKENLISDQAKVRCEVGKTLTAEVILEVEDSRGTVFRITRVFRSKKIDEREWQGESSSRLMIEESKITRWQSLSSDKHRSLLDRVLKPHLKPYMWFQGEQVDSLMNFQSKSSLMQAITLLSDIQEYDDLIDIAKSGSERAQKSYIKETNKLSKNKKESESLSKTLASIKIEASQVNEHMEANIEEKNEAQLNIDRLINQIDDANKKSSLKKDLSDVELRIDNDKKSLDEKVEGLNKKVFSNSWLLRSVQPVFNEFEVKYDSYYKAHTEKEAAGKSGIVKLPIDVPQPIHVNSMLADEMCFVCGRGAHKGSEEYLHIERLLGRKKKVETKVFEHDCSYFFNKLYINSLSYKNTIRNIDSDIAAEFSRIQDLRSSISDNSLKRDDINKQFEELVGDDRSDDIVSEFKTHTRNIERYLGLIAADELRLKDLADLERKVIDKFGSLVVGSVDQATSVVKDVYEHLYDLAKSTRKNVFGSLVKDLEDSANNIFQDMASSNNVITGRLKLKMLGNENCIPEIVDGDGFIMTGSNDSNIILIKLSLIMAIVTSRAKWSDHYSLISDAPTSKMSKKYSHGFYSALGSNFKQSIVMTYDFLSDEDRDILSDFNLGNVYKLEPVYPAGDGENRADLHIDIFKVS